jgi:hypothetical protein
MARSAPSNRVDEALRLARESHEMMKDAVAHTQVESVLMIALIGTLRDMHLALRWRHDRPSRSRGYP